MAGREHHPGEFYEVLPDESAEGRFRVYTIEGGTPQSGKGLSKTQATKQFRLLEGLAHGWVPTGQPSNLHPVPGQGGREYGNHGA